MHRNALSPEPILSEVGVPLSHSFLRPPVKAVLFLFLTTLLPTFASPGDYLKPLSVPEKSPWEVTGAASLGLATGNADTLTSSLQFFGTYEKDQSEAEIGAAILQSDNNGMTTTDNFRVDGKYSRTISGRFKVGGFLTFLADPIADLDYRLDLGLVPGYQFIRSTRTKLSLELGPGYLWEKQEGRPDRYASFRLAQRFEHKLTDRSKLWQALVLSPELSDFNNLLLTAQVGLDIFLNTQWGLRTSLRYQSDTTPAAGKGKDDFLLLAGVTYTLGDTGPPDEKGGFHFPRLKTKKTAAAPPGWNTSAGLDFSLARGNANSLLIGLSVDSAYRARHHETFIEGIYNRSENEGDTAADSLRTSVQHNRNLSERFFIGGTLGYFRDQLADVAYRLTTSLAAGYYLAQNENTTLSCEGGPGFTFEEVGGLRDEFLSFHLTQKLIWRLNEILTLKQSAGAIIDSSSCSDYLLAAKLVLETKITSHLSWRVAAAWTLDNTPAAGREKDDATLTSGISIQF